MKRILIFLAFLSATYTSWAQSDTAIAFAPLDPIPATGWYNIALTPSITARLNAQMGNFRLVGQDGQEIPYLLRKESAKTTETEIKWLPKVQEQSHERWYSRTIFRNNAAQPLDRLVLKVRNADVNRRFWLSGSDDNKNWYVIREDYVYSAFFDSRATYDLITLSFPPTDYAYLKVEVRHSWTEPIQVMGAGWYDYQTTKGSWQEISGIKVTPSDSSHLKQSFVDIDLGARHHVERLIFEVDGPEMYLRRAELQRVTRGSNGKPAYQPVREFDLRSDRVNELDLGTDRAARYRLVIQNQDDRPLRISGVRAYQLARFAQAKLNAENAIQLRIFDETAPTPSYDLVHFAAEIPADAPVATVAPLTEIPKPAKPQPTVEVDKPIFTEKAWIWGGIVVIVLLVGYMAMRVLRDMDKKPE